MTTNDLALRLRVAWWVRPYWALTRFGLWLGLPLDTETIATDIVRGIHVEVTRGR